MRIIHYLKIAVRQFSRHKLYPVIDIIALAIGFSSFILSGYWSYWEHSFDNFHPDASTIYQISRKGGVVDVKGNLATSTYFFSQQIPQLMNALPEATQICTVNCWLTAVAKIDNREFDVQGLTADSLFFSFFKPTFIVGSCRNMPHDKSVVILTESLARKLLGTTDCVGQQVNISGTKQIGGVITDFPTNSKFYADFILLDRLDDPYACTQDVHVRIPKKLKAQVQAKLDTLQLKDPSMYTHPVSYKLKTLQEVHLENDSGQERLRMVNTLRIAGWLMLIVALLNHLMLFFSLQQTRLKQNITYVSFGASKIDLTARYLTAFLLPLFVGYFFSLVIIEILFPYYQSFTSFEERSVVSLSQLYQYSFVTVLCIVALFIAIALLLLRLFIGRSTTRTQNSSLNVVLLRRSLIFVQVFIGVLFSLFSLTLYRQQMFANRFDVGLNIDHVVEVEIGFRNDNRYDLKLLRDRIASNPAITATTLSVTSVFCPSGRTPSPYMSEINLTNDHINYQHKGFYSFVMVSSDFFSFWGMTLTEGDWPDSETNAPIVNEAAVARFGKEGLQANFSSSVSSVGSRYSGKIAGVVENYHSAPITDPVQPLFISTEEGSYAYHYLYVRTQPGQERQIIDYLHKTVLEYAQSANLLTDQIEIQTVKKVLQSHYKTELLILYLFGGVSLFAFVITLFAIYLLVTLSTEQRRKEIAIRKINGAAFQDILHLFVREYLKLVIAANALAIPIAYLFMQQWLQYFTYHIEPNALFFILVMLASILIVYLSVAVQIRRSINDNPVSQIQSE